MAKPKTPSPQEIYRARRVREEKEKNALLPPGFVNHGNTCFMNSVLQGLIATQYLERLVLFKPIPPAIWLTSPIQITSRRSPALTNGHGLGGEYDQPWADGFSVGDQFIGVMRKAWEIQNNGQRESMSPRDLLAALGKKYDQYLDFRQQDAHEFLCYLLDAIRMEEVDAIKKRFPPVEKQRKRSRQSSTKPSLNPPSEQDGSPASRPPDTDPSHPAQSSTDADDQLLSFVDMLFSGKLTSILVCQACKNVSHTYEDFSDLSLSMKPEDYVRERRRDKLKQLAKKLGTALSVGVQAPRSSSVPATPVRDAALDDPEDIKPPRRRSVDLADVEVVAEPTVVEKPDDTGVVEEGFGVPTPSPPVPDSDSPPIPATPPSVDTPPVASIIESHEPQQSSGEHIMIVEPEKINAKEKKDKDESWAKISRRISVTVGLTRRPKAEKKEKKGIPLLSAPKLPDDNGFHIVSTPATPPFGLAENDSALEREASSLQAVDDHLHAQLANVKRSIKSTQLPINSPLFPSTPRFPLISRPSSPVRDSKPSKPRIPNPSAEEAAYLRDILADINDINPPNIPKPFSIFKQPKDGSISPFNAQSIFLKVNKINKIEECLRLFTSVEVLDGDNTVRCRRCWKIANGYYKPKARESAEELDSCSDSEDDEKVDAKLMKDSTVAPTSTLANGIPVTPPSNPRSPSHSTISLQDTLLSHDTQSTLTHTLTRGPPKPVPPSLQLNDTYPIELTSPSTEICIPSGLTIPSISATSPETPMSIKTARPMPSRGNTISSALRHTSGTTESSRMSLGAPLDQHQRLRFSSMDSNTESEISEADSETLLSIYSDVSSAASLNPSPNASQERLQRPSRDTPSKGKRHPSGVPRSKQYILRPAYKRYLIATPPPILVVHLKRFQQISKGPVVSFSTGFKKLDDYIAFPEHLDLAPYLAPRREDYFDSKVAVTRGRARRPAPCMYRLYAVVVHIGHLLGGHYVAYTALPPSSPPDLAAPSDNEKHPANHDPAPREWAFVSDTIVRLATLEEVLKSKAYICMYERI